MRLAVSSALLGTLCVTGCASSTPGGATEDDSDTARTAPDTDVTFVQTRLTAGDRRWRLDGQPESDGPALESLPGHNAFWFAWSVFHPGTELWGRSEPVDDATISSDSECLVPCDEIVQGCFGGLDCIPPLDAPTMVPAGSETATYVRTSDLVLGVLTSEGPRAYPHNILWWHEIANEEVGDAAYAATLCPLTGSGMLFDRSAFVPGQTIRLGVSGNLYNSNLVMWDSDTTPPTMDSEFSFWPQMRVQAVAGPAIGSSAALLPVFEMTWGAWRSLHPDTLVLSSETGFSRDYRRYPYGDYRTNDGDTFRPTNPAPDPAFENKDMVFGLLAHGEVRGYVWRMLEEQTGVATRRRVGRDRRGAGSHRLRPRPPVCARLQPTSRRRGTRARARRQ